MSAKHLLSKNVADKMRDEFRTKIDSLAAASEFPLTEDKVIKVFDSIMNETFMIVDEHGNIAPKERPMFTDPGYNPEPGTC